MFKLGIDVGYSTFKYVCLDHENKLIKKGYDFHKGNIREVYNSLINEIKEFIEDKEILLGLTGSLASRIEDKELYHVNNVVALVEGSVYKNSKVKSVIELGAQETKYISNIDSKTKSDLKFFMNSSCASGTGAFLEEQATRLSINFEEISELVKNATTIPRIAGRCSVFSKTDMIHHQQEGVKLEDILLGLCYSLVRNYKANVVQKNPINTPIMLTGGVIHNIGILRAIKDVFKLKDEELIIDEDFHLISCFGACKVAESKNMIISLNSLENIERLKEIKRETSIYKGLKTFGDGESLNKHNCKSERPTEGYLGVDVGSTSTNLVVIDEDNNVIEYIYTKTNGNPKGVVLENLEILKKTLGENFNIKGIGTTGSGRALIGNLLMADFVINEITAQAEGAMSIDSSVDTIFEIGGQDSKYISLEEGVVKEFEMNKICAAGTGAFIEEQVKKLGLKIEEFSEVALRGENPSNLGDRCTVFIEGNIGKEITIGESLENISAGLAYSIVKNYLNRVVGNRKIGNKIFIQGGIAHNQAIINAFRALLNKEIIVPEFFSVSGALGTAILTKKYLENKKSKDSESNVNDHIQKEGNKHFLEGYTGEKQESKKTVGIPRVLFINKMFPLFNSIFKKLGYNVILSDATNEEIVKLSQEYSFEETCFPVKLINGHVAWLLNKGVDYIFLPHLHTMKHEGSNVREDYACVYMQTSPKIIDSVFNLEDRGVELISPVLSFNFGKKYMIDTLLGIGKQLGKSIPETTLAVMGGMKKFFEYEKILGKLGEEVIDNLKDDEKAFVIISRVYNIVDPTLNMGIADRLKEMGYKVLNLGHIEANEMKLKKEYNNMYWPFGQHILTGAEVVRNSKNLYPIYITNHGCGPDTVLAHYFKKEMQGKPYLHIEVDEHSSKIGVTTRVEAFVNSLHNYKFKKSEEASKEEHIEKSNKVLLPSMYPYSEILKVFLEKSGKEVEILEEINSESIEYGKNFSMNKEYFSLIASLGEVINKVRNSDEKYTLYYPTTEGSEVFGQYGKLIKDKAWEIGKNINLEAPFIEDFLGDEKLGIRFAKAIIAGDVINLLDSDKKEKYLKVLTNNLRNNEVTDNYLGQLSSDVKKELTVKSNKKKLLVIGEALVVYKDYLNNFKLKELECTNRIAREPLAEIFYMFWSDFSNKRNKKNNKYIELLKDVKKAIEIVNTQMQEESPYNGDIDSLIEVLKDKLPIYSGGLGRYRLAKLLTYKNASAAIVVSSMYENTSTILKILREKYKKDIELPILDLYFDSNISNNTDELIETFINYLE